MKQKGFILSLLVLSFLLALPAFSGYKVVNGPKDFYFGHISYSEIKNDGKDPLVFREGQTRPEVAILNLPLGPGDTIKTSDGRRCEIQFDNGTVIRLDFNTDLKIETILAQSLSTAKKLSNLLLGKGQVYVMYNKHNSLEIFQVITPSAAVKLDHNAVALIKLTEEGNTDIQVERGKVNLLYGPDKSHAYQAKIEQKQRFIVSGDSRARPAEYALLSDFKSWNESINENFMALHEGSFLPKPIQNLPQAVFYFAQNFGNLYGQWVWHDLYGYVWRPYYNDYYPWGNWSPYIYGKWAGYQSQLFWIPSEPWGWVPYHLGIWMWDKNKGWLWLPGSAFAPAWAVWDFYLGHYFWRPWTLFDWYYGPTYISGFYYAGYQDYYYQPGPGQPIPPGQIPDKTLHSIRKDQLKKKDAPPLPLPKEMKKAYELTVAALKRGDESVLASLQNIPRQAAIVKRGDLTSPRIQERIIGFEQFSKQRESLSPSERTTSPAKPQDVSRDALRNIQRSRVISELEARTVPSPNKQNEPGAVHLQDTHFKPGQITPPSRFEESKGAEKNYSPGPVPGASLSQPSFRFRDWNPDVKTALRLGIEISYSSRTNEISCPQLGFSSRNVSQGLRLTEHGLSGSATLESGSPGTSSPPPSSDTPSSGAPRTKESEGGGQKLKN